MVPDGGSDKGVMRGSRGGASNGTTAASAGVGLSARSAVVVGRAPL